MGEIEAILEEIGRLINEQAKALKGRVGEEEAVNRAERIKELFERIKRDRFWKE